MRRTVTNPKFGLEVVHSARAVYGKLRFTYLSFMVLINLLHSTISNYYTAAKTAHKKQHTKLLTQHHLRIFKRGKSIHKKTELKLLFESIFKQGYF